MGKNFYLQDEEADYLLFPNECVGLEKECSCVRQNSCNNWASHDHGISQVLHAKQKKSSKKVKRGSKTKEKNKTPVELPEFKMEVDNDNDQGSPDSDNKWEKSKSPSSLKTVSSDNSSLKNELMEEVEFAEASDSVHSSNGSEMTPSDQRSNNENGSSMKESDGDAMSKKSDCSSDKQQSNSESESEMTFDKSLDKLFTTLNLCFPHLHKETSPWLAETELSKKVELQYSLKKKDLNKTLHEDMSQMADFMQPDLIQAQLRALLEDINDNGSASASAIGSSGREDGEPQDKGQEIAMNEERTENVQMVMDCMHGECMAEVPKMDDSVFDSLFGNM